jgi:hypothetical protein
MAGKVAMLGGTIRPQMRPIKRTMIGYSVRVNTMAATRAHKVRAERQEALREMLSKKCTVQQVIEISNKIAELESELDPVAVTRLKAAAEIKMKLISKYLPDVKAVEISGEGGGDLQITVSDFKNA